MPTNRKLVVAAVSVAAAASAIIAASTGASMASPRTSAASPQITRPATLRLLARGGTFTTVNVTHGKSFPQVGDELIVSQPVYEAAHPRQLAGHLYLIISFVAKGVPPAGTYQQAVLVLKHGEIDAVGAGSSPELAVTGGTGRYDGARGEADARPLSASGNRTSITITLLP
jgi:hypothetical protein